MNNENTETGAKQDPKTYYKNTVDRFIEDLKKTCHAMIDAEHISGSPVLLVKEAIDYIDEYYKDAKKDEKQRSHKFD